jgi:hypothetical protein
MATVLKGEMKGRRGRLEKTEDGHVYTETRKYIVLSNIRTESPYTVTATSGIPIVGLSVLAATGARCKSVDPEQDEANPQKWTVTAEFSTEQVDQKEDPADPTNPDPAVWIPVYKGVIETYPEVMYVDRTGAPYVNSAGDRFPEPLIKQKPILVYEFTQYELPSLTDIQIGDRTFSVNNATFKGFPEWTLMLSVKEFERGFFYGYERVKIAYRVAYKKDNWKDKPLDMGYSSIEGGGKVHQPTLVALNSPSGSKRSAGAAPSALSFEAPAPINFASFLR